MGEQKTLEFSLTVDEFDLLLLMMGLAASCVMRHGNKEVAYAFMRLVNRVNENNPNFVPYEIPATP